MIDDADIVESLPDGGYTGEITSLPGLRSFLSESDPFMDYIKSIKIDMPPGANIIGILQARRRVTWDQMGLSQMADWILMNPEQRRITLGDVRTGIKVNTPNPIAYDVWYLYYAGNVLLEGKHPDYSDDEWITLQMGGADAITDENMMYDYFHSIDSSNTLKPLRQPFREENVDTSNNWGTGRGFSSVWGMNTGMVVNDFIKDNWRFTIKEAWFELADANVTGLYWAAKEGPFDSTTHPPEHQYGPKDRTSHEPYCGYIAFPIGQLGVMWKVGLVSHSEVTTTVAGVYPYSSGSGLRPSGSTVYPVDNTTTVEAGGEILPPFTMATSEVPGELLIDKGWLIKDDSCVEFPAASFDGEDNWKLHYWLRYWIKKENTEIIPGEFVGLICKPWPLHAWFYQASSPFVYAGNYIETEFYTSGIIKEVLEPWTSDDPMPSSGYYDPDEQVSTANGNHYRIWIKGEEMIVESSDWKEYEVGERVGLLKSVRDGGPTNHVGPTGTVAESTSPSGHFDWKGLKYQKLKGKNTSDDDIYTREWVIVPVWFFPDANTYPMSMG